MRKKLTRLVAVITSIALLSSGAQVSAKKSLPVSFKKSTISLKIGSSKKLSFTKKSKKKIIKIIKWKSANKKIAKVTSKGKVTGIKAGKTNISAVVKLKTGKKYTLKCKVKVAAADATPLVQVSPAPTSAVVPTSVPTSSGIVASPEAPKTDVTITGSMKNYLLEYYITTNANAIIKNKSDLDTYIKNTFVEVSSNTAVQLKRLFADYNDEYFSQKALVIGVYGFGRGYEQSMGDIVIPADSSNQLKVTINMEYVVPTGQVVTDDIVTYLSIIEVEQTAISGVTKAVYDYPTTKWLYGKNMKGYILEGNTSIDVNAMIRTKEELDTYIAETYAEVSADTASEIENLFADYDEEFFTQKALCIGGYDLGRGYKNYLSGISLPVTAPERIDITIEMYYDIPEDQAVTDDIVKYISVVEFEQEDLFGITDAIFEHFVWK